MSDQQTEQTLADLRNAMMAVVPCMDHRTPSRRQAAEDATIGTDALLLGANTSAWDAWRYHALRVAAILVNAVIDLEPHERTQEAMTKGTTE